MMNLTQYTCRLKETLDYNQFGPERIPRHARSFKEFGQVNCKEVKDEGIRSGRGSRHVEIYHLISTSTQVEIAELEGKRYAVMEDVRRDDPTLAVMIDPTEPNDPLTQPWPMKS